MIFNSGINPIQRQYTTAVNPVHLFEANNSKNAQQSAFNFSNQTLKNQNSGYNPSHPNVQTSSLARNLDIMS